MQFMSVEFTEWNERKLFDDQSENRQRVSINKNQHQSSSIVTLYWCFVLLGLSCQSNRVEWSRARARATQDGGDESC
jgi:hypothetical protein